MEYFNLYDDTKILIYGKCNCCDNIDFISKSIIDNKCWEPNITGLFHFLYGNKIDNILFDVGANIGYFSLISSKFCQNIYSFDVNKITNINTYCKCIVDSNNKFYKTNNISGHNIGALRIEECDQTSSNIENLLLDDFIIENNIDNIDIMKIDIEGSELICLGGLKKTLTSDIIKNVIIEVTPLWGIEEAVNILKILNENNYRLYDVDDYNFKLILNNPIDDIRNYISTVKVQTNILGKKILL